MQEAGEQRLAAAGYDQYEIFACPEPNRRCVHNLDYWQFGDYPGIGAGTHDKVSNATTGEVQSRWKARHVTAVARRRASVTPKWSARPNCRSRTSFEYMLNALRLRDDLPITDFAWRASVPVQ